MKNEDASNPLLDYFSELLTDTEDLARPNPPEPARPASAASIPAQPPVPSEPKPQPAPSPEVVPLPQSQLAALEESKRRQLQGLLSRQLTSAPKVVTEAAPVSKKIQVPAEEVPVAVQPDLSDTPLPAEASDAEADAAYAHSINSVLEWAANGRPQWAQQRFDVLLFSVSGLTLAVPLIALGQIQYIGDQLTPIFGQSEWFMGLLNSPQGQIRTVNTALFVMPEKYSTSFLETAKYVISIDGLPWGLAVDTVNQPIRIDPADVKWRTQRTSRPWLAGTVKSAMCALIDIPQMGAMLKASERRNSGSRRGGKGPK